MVIHTHTQTHTHTHTHIYIYIYIYNITVELHVFYIFKTRVKFQANRWLFTIRSINFFFLYNIRL